MTPASESSAMAAPLPAAAVPGVTAPATSGAGGAHGTEARSLRDTLAPVAEAVVIGGGVVLSALLLFGALPARGRGQEPARGLRGHVEGVVRHPLLAERVARQGGAADADRAVHGAAGAARHGGDRQRGRAAARWPRRRDGGPALRAATRRGRRSPRCCCSAASSAAAGSRSRARCASSAASTRRSARCCSTTSRSALFSFTVEDLLRDPTSLNKPSTVHDRRGQHDRRACRGCPTGSRRCTGDCRSGSSPASLT